MTLVMLYFLQNIKDLIPMTTEDTRHGLDLLLQLFFALIELTSYHINDLL